MASITLSVSASYRFRIVMRGTEPYILIRIYVNGSRRATRHMLPATEANIERLQRLVATTSTPTPTPTPTA